MKHLTMCAAAALPLSACATTSFAPPTIRITYEGNAEASRGCATAGETHQSWTVAVTRDVAGATKMIETFIAAYVCSEQAAANGRQAFEVPAFLATAGAATAGAFGAGADVIIAGGAASSVLGSGKSYYAPKDKAAIYDSALDALYCIQNEGQGIDAIIFDQWKPATQQAAEAFLAKMAGSEQPPQSAVTVTPESQYFALISSALGQVQRIATTRLSNTGNFDAAGVAAEIKQAADQARQAQAAAGSEGKKPEQDAGASAEGAGGSGDQFDPSVELDGTSSGKEALAFMTVLREQQNAKQEIKLKLSDLKPKLDQCVVRAKI